MDLIRSSQTGGAREKAMMNLSFAAPPGSVVLLLRQVGCTYLQPGIEICIKSHLLCIHVKHESEQLSLDTSIPMYSSSHANASLKIPGVKSGWRGLYMGVVVLWTVPFIFMLYMNTTACRHAPTCYNASLHPCTATPNNCTNKAQGDLEWTLYRQSALLFQYTIG